MNQTHLDGKTAIVTGGGTGIGQGIALALSGEGVRVTICGRRADPLEQTLQTIRQIGGKGLAVPADVAKEDDVQRVVDATLEAWGAVDILVSNAAIFGGGRIHQHSIEVWDQVMAVNLRGAFLMARAVLPRMRGRRQGHILIVSSEAGLEYWPGNGVYGIAKHALNALSEYIQRENQHLGIRVDTICPGWVVTEMTEDNPGLHHDKCLYPDDIAALALWLLTRRANIKIGRPVLIQTMKNPWK